MKTLKLFLVSLWYRVLYSISPKWLRLEIARSMYCRVHKGITRCDCWEQHVLTSRGKEAENKEFQLKSHFWYEQQKLRQQLEELEAELFNSKNSAKCWHEAWFDQRDATGKAYWNGYSNGKRVAIAFHMREAAKRKSIANGMTDSKDKLSQELDARYHEWSAEQIKLQGHDVEYNMHPSDPKFKSEGMAIRWRPSDGFRSGEKDR